MKRNVIINEIRQILSSKEDRRVRLLLSKDISKILGTNLEVYQDCELERFDAINVTNKPYLDWDDNVGFVFDLVIEVVTETELVLELIHSGESLRLWERPESYILMHSYDHLGEMMDLEKEHNKPLWEKYRDNSFMSEEEYAERMQWLEHHYNRTMRLIERSRWFTLVVDDRDKKNSSTRLVDALRTTKSALYFDYYE